MVIYDSYFSDFNQMISDELEESITLYYPESRSDCPNCYLDTFGAVNRSVSIYKAGGPEPFENGQPCPHCDGKGYEAVHETEVIPGRAYIKNKEFKNTSGINIPQGSYEFVCKHIYYPKIVRAAFMIPGTEIMDFVTQRYYLSGQPDITGFKMNPVKYLSSFWVKNNG
jgi:hypothetical protein